MKKKLLITHHYMPEEKAGGITSVMRNMHPYFSEVFDVDYMTLPKSWQHGSTRAAFFLYMWLHKKRLKKYDFILSHVPESSYFVVKSGVPCAHVYHGDGHPMGSGGIKKLFVRFYDNIFDVINNYCPLVFCVGTKRRPDNKKLYNPLIQDVKPVPIEKRKGFVFTGRLVPLKRVDRIIQIYAKLPQSIRKENPFYIIGDGQCREKLELMVSFYKLDGQVLFLGNIPNAKIMQTVATKRLLLMASTSEGFPTSIAEAFSVGVPAITTSVGSVTTVVKNGFNGYYVPKDFVDADYLKCIENVFADYPHYVQGALTSAKLFNAERVTKEVIEEINKILSRVN